MAERNSGCTKNKFVQVENGIRLKERTNSCCTKYKLPLDSGKVIEVMEVEKEAKPSYDVNMRETLMKRSYTCYSDQDKVRFFKLMFEKCLSAAAAAKQLGIHVRTASGKRWAKQYEKDPDNIFEKRKKMGRPRILQEEHKSVILECIDDNPSVVLDEVMKKLKQIFTELKVSKSTLFDFVKKHCKLSLKKARFHPIDRNSEEKIQERLDWVHHYPHMKGYYLVMDNAPIHTSEDIAKYVESRGYHCVYLPPYSPGLNPIEQFWSVVKSKVKRSKFLEKETLMTRIGEASNSLRLSDFKMIVRHSHKCLDKCRNRQAL
ncbi:hypothetical protein G6F62_006361 [Rhizopus arrhizus]|nr:hypothetical protein G6F24_009734 [Rhizopus arrhizus]KAG0908733.1 hypothetical protein G6F33_009427 [Rhizopus arrhizus]KAG1336135.1 hypothetical protein G6F62_006361 [Rhizopus arrhizus]